MTAFGRHQATLVKLEQLVKDAEAKAAEARTERRSKDALHWRGFADGIRRSINVVEGRG